MVRLRDIYGAYEICRINKMSAASTIDFDIDYRENLQSLCRDINNRVYTPSRSIAFLVYKPTLREIFAADYRDRVVHHYIDIRLRPLIEKELVETTCNNRIGKGTSAAVSYLENAIRDVSENYTKDCYIAKMDMQGFFMSIRKSLVRDMAVAFTQEKYMGEDKEELIYLLDISLMNHPEKNCILKTKWSEWGKLAKNKSLFFVDDGLGLTLGDLLSQLMANFFLNEFDHYIGELGFTHYGRYVDDFYIVHESKEKILEAIPLIREKLKSIGVTLHPKKFYIQHYSKGVEFVGSVIKPGRTYVHNRTVHNAFNAIGKFNDVTPDVDTMEQFMSVANSYLGFMKNRSTFHIRKKLIQSVSDYWWEYFTVSDDFTKVILKKQYKRIEITKNKLKTKRRREKYVSRGNQSKMAKNSRIRIAPESDRLSGSQTT